MKQKQGCVTIVVRQLHPWDVAMVVGRERIVHNIVLKKITTLM